MEPVACQFFEGAEHDTEIEAVSVALDRAAAAIGVALNQRTEDAVSWPAPGTPEPMLPDSITHGWPEDS